jgi:Diacylglycerol kinase catalytic domain
MTAISSSSIAAVENQSPAPLWPIESANLVALQWKSGSKSRSNPTKQLCKLVYDATHHYIRIIDSTTNDVLDTIDAFDVVGASVEIDMNEVTTSAEPRAAVTNLSTNEPSNDAVPADTQAHAKLTVYVYARKAPKSMLSSLYHSFSFSSKPALGQPTPNYIRPTDFKNFSPRYAHHRSLIVEPVEDMFHVKAVVSAIQKIAQYYPTTSTEIIPPKENSNSLKNYIIICNPRSGPHRNAVEIVERHVIPMLTQANIETTLCVTTHPGHAVELCHLRENDEGSPLAAPLQQHLIQRLASDIAYYSGIVVMGGDGTLHEVIQGIQSRSDAKTIFQTIPIGIIGCGTANGLATSLSYTSFLYGQPEHASVVSSDFSYKGIVDDIFAIAKGYSIAADISTYSILLNDATNPQTPAGPSGQTSTETQISESRIKEYISFLTFSYGIIAEIDIESELIHWMGVNRFDVWAVVRVLFLRRYPATLSYTTEPIASGTALPSMADSIPSTWITIKDDIVLFWASHVSHVSSLPFFLLFLLWIHLQIL